MNNACTLPLSKDTLSQGGAPQQRCLRQFFQPQNSARPSSWRGEGNLVLERVFHVGQKVLYMLAFYPEKDHCLVRVEDNSQIRNAICTKNI